MQRPFLSNWDQHREGGIFMPGKNASPVGRQIRAARQRAGLSQERLAEHLHVTRQAISNWESGVSQS